MTDSTHTHTAADGSNDTSLYAQSYGTDVVVQTAVAALSQRPHLSDQLTPSANNANGRKRKATSAPGSRGVANLTPDRLAKKRANDREAQRAIRERTRNTIDGLEQRIKELESQQAFQDLQKVVAERDQALAECDDLRRRLAAVAGIVGSNSPHANANDSLNELAALTAQQSPLPPLPPALPQQTSQGSSYEAQRYLHPDLRSPHSTTHDSPVNRTPPTNAVYHAGEHQKWTVGMARLPSTSQYMPQAGSLAYASHLSQNPALMQQSNGDRLDLNYVLDSAQHKKPESNTSIASHHSPSGSVQRSLTSPSAARTPDTPIWSLTPPNCSATCPLDALLGDFIEARRQQLRSGMSKHEVMGPDQPFWAAFTSDSAVSEQNQGRHPVSALLIDILSKFPDICRLPEKAAVLYVMFSVLKWQSCPCKECYDMVPDFSKPTPLQLEQPHALWFDHLPWVSLRISLVKNPVNFDDFFVPYTTTLSLNWPYPEDQVLMHSPDPSDPMGVKLNPVFETHLRDITNWSVGTPFKQAHPHLVGEGMRIEDRPR